MSDVKFRVDEKEGYTIVSFELNNLIIPNILALIKPPRVKATKGVILSGRGPIWLYCYLTHHYHPTKFIATYDPRSDGAVVVESHTPEHKVGDIIKMEE